MIVGRDWGSWCRDLGRCHVTMGCHVTMTLGGVM